MSIIKKDGYSGKICNVCKSWKILAEFPIDKKNPKFKGFRLMTCSECVALMKKTQKT